MKISWRRILNKKGVSPIIGVVLLSAVLLSVLALFFVWRASQEELQFQRERDRIKQLKMVQGESVEFVTIPDEVLGDKSITFYSNGTTRPDILHVYLNGVEIDESYYSVTWDGTDPRKGYIEFVSGTTEKVTESFKVESQLGNLYSYQKPAAVIDLLSWNDVGEEVILLLDGSKSNSVGGTVDTWTWEFYLGTSIDFDTTLPNFTEKGGRVNAHIPKDLTLNYTWTIRLLVKDNVTPTLIPAPPVPREGISILWLTIPSQQGSGEGGNPGFGGEGAPGGIYISLGGSGGGTSVAEGRVISFHIKNFSGRMIPLNSLRFYGVKNPSNYTCNQIYIAPAGKEFTAEDLYYSGVNIGDGGIAQFSKTYYIGDRDEAHIELRASSGARPQEGHIFMIIMYDCATPMSYYVVTVPIRTADNTDDIYFDPADVFHVLGSGDTLQGKSLDLRNAEAAASAYLMSLGVAFSTPAGGEPCDDRMIEFNVAGTAYWEGSVESGSSIFLGDDTDADGVPDTGVTWENSRTIQFKFNFFNVAQRFYYFVYRFGDGTSVAQKIPRFDLTLGAGETERKDLSAATGGIVTWVININQIDILDTPMDMVATGTPCFCTATFSPEPPYPMPYTTTLTIEVLPGAPTGLYPIVITGNNHNIAYSVVVYLYLAPPQP